MNDRTPDGLAASVAYIAAPFAADSRALSAWNVQRASFLGRLAFLEGKAPIVQHTSILSGVYGNDDVAADRARGLECSLAILRGVMQRGASGELWVLYLNGGGLSPGVRAEFVLWNQYRRDGIRKGTWMTWRDLAERHGLGHIWNMLREPIKLTGDLAAAFGDQS